MSSPIAQAMKEICEEKGIAYESVLETVEAALAAAYRKDFGEVNQNVKVKFDPETGAIQAFDEKEVVTDEFVAAALKEIEERRAQREIEMQLRAEGKLPEAPLAPIVPVAPAVPQLGPDGQPLPEEKKYNPKLHLALAEARTHQSDVAIGETITIPLPVPGNFGRMAAQTAKQVVMQRLREAERDTIYNQWKGREGELILGTVHRREARVVLVDLGARANGVLREDEQIPTDRYVPGARFKFILYTVGKSLRGPELLVSRTHPDLVRKLFHMEVPEVASGAVEIRSVAREPGSRAKVSVISTQENVDPIGACIGQRGTRVQTVIAELGGEKIDIIPHSDDPKTFIANAMAPAKATSVLLDEANRLAVVLVAADQFSLAIGRGGQNVRLAARLTGWRISVQEARSGADSPDAPAGAGQQPQAASIATEDGIPPTESPEATTSSISEAPAPSPDVTDVVPEVPTPSVDALESTADADSPAPSS